MPFIGSIIPASVAGLDPKAQRLRREREEKKQVVRSGEFARALDEAELTSVEEIEEAEESRAAKEVGTEEGREDREKMGYYEPGGKMGIAPQPPRIDLEG